MRQVFFLLASAMFAAFSLSWAAPANSTETYFAVPNHVSFPKQVLQREKVEILASITLKDTCESIEKIEKEVRGNKVIFSIRLFHPNDRICLQQERTHVPVDLSFDNKTQLNEERVDIYFREDDENLKFFGSIQLKRELVSLY